MSSLLVLAIRALLENSSMRLTTPISPIHLPDFRLLSERLLKPPPQLIYLTLRKPPEALFKLSLHHVPGAFHLKLVLYLDILEAAYG
jgi:hypothetical protein